MIHPNDISALASQWEARAKDKKYSGAYRDAVSECLYELRNLCTANSQDEDWASLFPPEEVWKAMEEQEADSYLASLEAHEA